MGDVNGKGVLADRKVVACLDRSAAARPVLQAAQRLAELTGLTVEAVHVADEDGGSSETVEALTARIGVRLEVLHGSIESTLVERLSSDDVEAGVLGARSTPLGRRPVGGITRRVIEASNLPILVVPPGVVAPPVFRRAVVPLDGNVRTSLPVAERVVGLLGTRTELVVLHVFTDQTIPKMLDHPSRDMAMLAEEFLARHLPVAVLAEMHVGPVAVRAQEMCRAHDADLMILSWSRQSQSGRAQTIKDVLSNATVPVLLVPDTVAPPAPGPVQRA